MSKKKVTSFGVLSPDFLTQWNAKKLKNDGNNKPIETNEISNPNKNTQDQKIAETLPSWKKDGRSVTVTKVAHNAGSSLAPKTNQHQSKFKRSETSTNAKKAMPNLANRNKSTAVHLQAPSIIINSENQDSCKIQKVAAPPTKTPRQKLREASAVIHNMKITGAKSQFLGHQAADPIVEKKGAKTAILGLDFGTAFTKAVIRWEGEHYAVDWSNAVNCDDPYLLASVFSEHEDGECVLGSCDLPKWRILDGIKLKILSSNEVVDQSNILDAVIFQSLAFRYANQWLRSNRKIADVSIRWRLHVGLPTQSWDDSETSELFKKIAQAARLLAISPGVITRQNAMIALEYANQVDRPAVDVFPEFACQLYSYLRSSQRQDDLHALVDIGAGTVDMAFFNVFVRDDIPLLPVFAADVQNLGSHYLISALAGTMESGHIWDDRDSSLSDKDIAGITGEEETDISSRRRLFLSSIAEMFNNIRQRANISYETSPAFTRNEVVKLFLCGGGSRIACIQQHFDRIVADSPRVVGVRFEITNLVKPDDIVGKIESNFDRLSVAYGLSQLGANIGDVMRSADLEPLSSRIYYEAKDRDEDR